MNWCLSHMEKHYPPAHMEKQFHCIHCGVFSAQSWRPFYYRAGGVQYIHDDMKYCVCEHCSRWSYWYKGNMVVPCEAPVPPAHADMPQQCRADYDEARTIVAASPRAAAALLRLAAQELMPLLGENGKNINDDIGALVAKGLPIQVQQALDFCRVIGNNAVHPGEIDLNDTPEIAHNLFDMLNFIVEDRLSRPKHIRSLYEKLPEAVRKAIGKRDGAQDQQASIPSQARKP